MTWAEDPGDLLKWAFEYDVHPVSIELLFLYFLQYAHGVCYKDNSSVFLLTKLSQSLCDGLYFRLNSGCTEPEPSARSFTRTV